MCGKAPANFSRTRFLNLIHPRHFWACFNFISGDETLLVRTSFILYKSNIVSALNSLPQQISRNKTGVERFGEFGHYFLQQLHVFMKKITKALAGTDATLCRDF